METIAKRTLLDSIICSTPYINLSSFQSTDSKIYLNPFKNKRRQALQTLGTAIHYSLSIARLP